MTAVQIKFGFGIVVAVGIAAALVIQREAQTRLLRENQSLSEQVDRLQSQREDLSHHLARVTGAHPLPENQLDELLRLRNEVGFLRRETNELDQWQAALQDLQQQAELTPPETATGSLRDKEIAMYKMDLVKQGYLGIVRYFTNEEEFPANFYQVSRYLTNPIVTADLINHFALAPLGSHPDDRFTNPANVIVIEEKQPCPTPDGHWVKAYGFANGHIELHTQDNKDFSAFEQQHSLSPPTNP